VSPFASDIESWQSAYVLIGGMAATLTGLLFVGVSINLRTVMSRSNPGLRHSAIRTFNQFALIVELSIVFQIPQQSPLTLGLAIVVLALFALVIVFSGTRETPPDVESSRWESAPGIALLLAFALVGALIATGAFELLFLMVSLVMVTLISAMFSAWSLLVEVGQDDEPASGEASQSA
jgi:hypothetical protein